MNAMWQQLRQQTLEKFEPENCSIPDRRERSHDRLCFLVKTNAAVPPSVLIDREVIVPSRGETAFFKSLVTHVNSWTNTQNRSSWSMRKRRKGKTNKEFPKVSRCRRAQQRQRMKCTQKVCFSKVAFLLITPIVVYSPFSLASSLRITQFDI